MVPGSLRHSVRVRRSYAVVNSFCAWHRQCPWAEVDGHLGYEWKGDTGFIGSEEVET